MKNIDQIAAEVESIRLADAHRTVRPDAVVEFARENPDSALHARFTWDDGEAATKWRLEEARRIIKAVVVTLPNSGKRFAAYVSLPSDRPKSYASDDGEEPSGYRRTEDVIASAAWRSELRSELVRDLDRLRSQYAILEEECRAIEEATRRIKASGTPRRQKAARERAAA